MTRLAEDAERRMVPRWRLFRDATRLAELRPVVSTITRATINLDAVHERISDWRRERTLSFAGDVLGSAFAVPGLADVDDAARYVLSREDAPPSLRWIAKGVVEALTSGDVSRRADKSDHAAPSRSSQQSDILQHRQRIAHLKKHLLVAPSDAIAWTSLARDYAILGQKRQSLRAISVAVTLAGTNRFILRSAVRGYVHFDDADAAWTILRRSGLVRSDPWLIAAEIATAMITGRSSRTIKDARKVLADKAFAPSQLTELASSLASLELDAGANQRARKLFRLAMQDPNDNSVAQAEWATRVGKLDAVGPDSLETAQSFEARAWDKYARGEWQEALVESLSWLDDEPFSSRPAQFGLFVASVLVEDYDVAESMGVRGLAANPDDQAVLNNLAFTLASAGKISAAVAIYERMQPTLMSRDTTSAWLATGGLIQFRLGAPDLGRESYRFAMDLAERTGAQAQCALASAYLAREELLAGSPFGEAALRNAEEQADHSNWSVVKTVVARIRSNNEKLVAATTSDGVKFPRGTSGGSISFVVPKKNGS
jgi:tetratricopeptide (TPR) repeat protein